MLDMMQTALNGLRVAEARAAQAATNIAAERMTDAAAPAAAGADPGATVVSQPTFVQAQTSDGSHPDADARDYATAGEHDLATQIIELKLAQHAYEANLTVVRTADEMTKHLFDRFV